MVEHSGFEAASRSFHSLGQIRNSRAGYYSRTPRSFAHYAFSRFRFQRTAHRADAGYGAPALPVAVLQVSGSNRLRTHKEKSGV